MTFADPNLIEAFNRSLVPCELGWFDRAASPKVSGQFQYPEVVRAVPWAEHGPLEPVWRGEGYGTMAVYCVFSTPDGTVLSSLAGAWSAEVVLSEAQFVCELWGRLKTQRRSKWASLIRAAHAKRAEHWKDAPLPETSKIQWKNPRGLMVATHHLHARRPPPTMKRMWEVARMRCDVNACYSPNARDMGRFYRAYGGF